MRHGLKPFVWPLALLAVAVVLIGAGQALARLDGFRLYGMVQGHGEIVGAIGLVWLAVAGLRRLVLRSSPTSRSRAMKR